MKRLLTGLLLFYSVFNTAFAQDYRLETLTDKLQAPWCVAFLPGGDLLVTERAGQLRRLSPSGDIEADIKGVPDVYFAGQGGLFDVALHPGFDRNKLVYLSFAEGPAKQNATAIARGRLAGSRSRGARVEADDRHSTFPPGFVRPRAEET